MAIFLVRHAKAENRSRWADDDQDRPLTESGREQAVALAERIASLGDVPILVSSPARRCVETLAPLAEQLGSAIRVDHRLAEGRGFSGALELLEGLPDGAVLCSHGDVIPETIDALIRRGLDLTGPPDWRKASVWVLDRSEDGFRSACAWPPPGREPGE